MVEPGTEDHDVAVQDTIARHQPEVASTATNIQDTLAKHQAEHGCVLPMNQVAAPQQTVQVHALSAAQQASPAEQATLPGFLPFPMEVPSNRQNRTTQTIGTRARHPTNMNKPLLITTQDEDNNG